MKTLIRNAAGATLISAVFATSAFAMSPTATSQSVSEALAQSSVDVTGLNVSVRNSVATITGTANDSSSRARAAQVVQNVDGVTDVVNLITGS